MTGVGRGLAALAAVLSLAVPAWGATDRSDVGGILAAEVAVFYYPWYGNPASDGAYLHWGQRVLAPPLAIGSSFYPARGVYSSRDPAVVASQMDDLARVGATTVVVSWWGPGSREDSLLDLVVRSAHAAGLRTAAHVEPYEGRTPQTVVRDVALLRTRGIEDFYVYDSTKDADEDWAAANAALDGVRMFSHTSLPGKARAGGFDGLYTYDVLVNDGNGFGRMCRAARALGLLCAPSVGPGFDARRATGEVRVRQRGHGRAYDHMWQAAVRARADVVTVTSYNEWHEGTQIEPARAVPGYASYAGAWGKVGSDAERAYLERTAYWVERFAASKAASSAATGTAPRPAQ